MRGDERVAKILHFTGRVFEGKEILLTVMRTLEADIWQMRYASMRGDVEAVEDLGGEVMEGVEALKECLLGYVEDALELARLKPSARDFE